MDLGLGEYLSRALSHRATLVEPKDLAQLLASYARDGLWRVEAAGDAPSLNVVRSALEEALGVRFEGQRGAAFFRSTLVQTLFYGVFAAWVLWARQTPPPAGRFDWRTAVWHLRAPVLRALFQQLSDPGRLQPLGLVEVLDWTSAALDRVDRVAFFDRFSEGQAVPYFYEPFLEAFDIIRIDSLNGDKYRTGKTTPDGTPDPSIFSTPSDPVGIQVGTAITTLVRKTDHAPTETVGFRNLWGQAKHEDLTASAEAGPDMLYNAIEPLLELGLPFAATTVSENWSDWPSLPDLFPVSFPGVQTKRDSFLIDIDLERLKSRVADYFTVELSDAVIAQRYPIAMKSSSGFVVRDAHSVRQSLVARGGPYQDGFVRHSYRPFDGRWLYWDEGKGLLGRPVPEYKPNVFEGNLWFVSQQKPRREWSPPQVISTVGCLDLIDRGATCIPAWRRDNSASLFASDLGRSPNLSPTAQAYLDRLSLGVEDLFHHVLTVLHDPVYRQANAGALRMEWPRIPLPGWPDADAPGVADELAASATRGRELAQLLDSDTPVPGVTTGALRLEVAPIAIPATVGGHNISGEDFLVTAGWGHFGTGDAVMPGQGSVEERPYTATELVALGDLIGILGETTFDIYLNDQAYWRNVPAAIWSYKLGGYQVLKKWLSYRERKVLDRPLLPEEVQHFTDTARRIAAILVATNADAK